MTEQQKEILTAKMLDAPASLSDEELALIGNDPELRDIYEMSASIATASAARTRFDMAEPPHSRAAAEDAMDHECSRCTPRCDCGIGHSGDTHRQCSHPLSASAIGPAGASAASPFGHYAGTLDQGRS